MYIGKHHFDLTRPVIMGILNVTPDSFSDGGQHHRLDDALRQAELMYQQGASIIDIGGESTRPGAAAVDQQLELDRVIPVIEKIHASLDVAISIDTNKATVMLEAVNAGAGMINDVLALQSAGALEAVATMDSSIALCLMHMQGQPRTMQLNPAYDDVVSEVYDFLQQRIRACEQVGIDSQRIIVDPGFGFGKTLQHNLLLLKNLDEFLKTGCQVLAGISRKSMIGTLLGDVPVDQRLIGSVAAAMLACEKGAKILRVHDAAETADALKIFNAVQSASA